MAYTKERTQEIFDSAVAIVEAFGIQRLDNMSRDSAKAQLVAMYHQLKDETGVTFETARQYIAKACRRMRSPDWKLPERGGARNGAGRPRLNSE